MNLIRTIRQSDVQSGLEEPKDVTYRERLAARAVLMDGDGRVALMHARVSNYYKLPGGGVEEGEDMHLALAREIMEEVGAKAEVLGDIGRVEEWRQWDNDGMHQVSDAYLARVSGPIGQPEFTEKELAAGFEVYWAQDLHEAIDLVSRTLEHENMEVRFMSLRDRSILEAAHGAINGEATN